MRNCLVGILGKDNYKQIDFEYYSVNFNSAIFFFTIPLK